MIKIVVWNTGMPRGVRQLRFPQRLALVALGCMFGGAVAHSEAPGGADPDGIPPFAITEVFIAGGGIARASNPCFDLVSTIGQPVTGKAVGGLFSLTVGFWNDPVSNDSIFRSSFEACSP